MLRVHTFTNCVHQRVVNFINGLIAIYFNNLPLLPIIVQQANSLVKEDVQATLDRFSNIVGALIQFATIQITYTRLLGRARIDVINVLTGSANVTPGKPL